jgi:hypothetical protein
MSNQSCLPKIEKLLFVKAPNSCFATARQPCGLHPKSPGKPCGPNRSMRHQTIPPDKSCLPETAFSGLSIGGRNPLALMRTHASEPGHANSMLAENSSPSRTLVRWIERSAGRGSSARVWSICVRYPIVRDIGDSDARCVLRVYVQVYWLEWSIGESRFSASRVSRLPGCEC